MIVVCATCHARFKVADEKIGPRGAKVRCSKCQTVFVVHKDLGVVPAEPTAAPPPPAAPAPRGLELDLESEPMGGTRPSGFLADPFSRASADPFSIPAAHAPAEPSPQAADPFAAAPAPPPADPFASPDPFGASSGAGGGAFGSVDPFVATVASPAPGLPTSAVTDLSDLIGHPASTPVPAGKPPHPAPSSTPVPEPSGILETGFDFDLSGPPAPELEGAPTPSPGLGDAGPDLTLSERTPSPRPATPSVPMPGLDDFAGADPFAAQGGFEVGGGQDFGGPDEDFVAAPAPAAAAAPPVVAPSVLAPAPAPATPPVLEAPTAAVPEEEAAVGLRRRASRVRALLINAISLVALVALAAGILAFWRGGRPGAGGGRTRALFGALSEPPQPFGVSQLRSGLFERADAAPVLFVAGSAVSSGPAVAGGLRVRVELVRKGVVLARGEARAGAVPSPEELNLAQDGAALAAVYRRLEAKAPGAVKPGEAVPFLVAISDYPSDVAGIGLKVTVEPAGSPAAGEGARAP